MCSTLYLHWFSHHSDAKIDAVALGLLKENDVASLIPLIGDRVKFQANLSLWKNDNQSLNVGVRVFTSMFYNNSCSHNRK